VVVGAALSALLAPAALLRPAAAWAAQNRFPDFPTPPSDQLKTSAVASLGVGVYVMDDPAEQKTYFDVNLKQSGITPLWLGISNLSADQRFWFDVGEIAFSADRASFASGSNSVNESGATALVITDLFVGSLVLGLIGESMLAAASKAKKNLIDRGLNSHTLGPGGSASGFVYIRRDKAHVGVAGCTLSVVAHVTPSAAGAAPLLCNVTL
jgi:hypothetical protein